MVKIERQYLPPLSSETKITEADRQRIYDIVREQLADLLEGDDSYYPDGVQKDLQARTDDLNRFIGSVWSLQGRVDDPADIIGDVIKHLQAHSARLRAHIKNGGPSDPIELPPGSTPMTRDHNELYVDPNPIAPPTEIAPRHEWQASFAQPSEATTRRPEFRLAPPIFFPFR